MLGDDFSTDEEMDFLTEIFDSDRKNYHAWSYRIWLIERFQLWAEELEFVDEMLEEDKGNNSVWSYRYFILNKAPIGLFKQDAPGTLGFVKSEVELVINHWLPKDLCNEACWCYLRGMLCSSDEEEVKSQRSNAKRVNINKLRDVILPGLQSFL